MGYGNSIISNKTEKAPSALPVTVAEAKSWINQPFAEDDTMIEAMLTATRQYIEDKCNISIGQQTHVVQLSTDGERGRFVPSQPMISLDSVEYTNCDCLAYEPATAGTYSTIGEMGDFVQFKGQAGYWRLTYVCGYKTLPESLKAVVKSVFMSMYEQRGDSSWSVPAWIKDQMKQFSRKSWV
jgi:hypothetical protein